MKVSLRYEDAVLRVAIGEGLCLVRWADSPQPRHFSELLAAMRTASAQSGHAAMLSVVDAKGKLPRFTDEVRGAAQDMAKQSAPLGSGTAHVILVEGFTGAAVRMFVSTLNLLSRSQVPTSVHASIPQAAAWLAEHAPGWSAGQIEAAYVAGCL